MTSLGASPSSPTALFHLDEDDGLPDVIGEAGAAAVLGGLANAELGLAADIERAAVAEGLHQAVEEDLRLAFFVAGEVGCGPGGEFSRAGAGMRSGEWRDAAQAARLRA